MMQKLMVLALAVVMAILCNISDAAQEKKKEKRTGTVIGEVKSTKDTPNKKNIFLEVLAPGEEKARKYFVVGQKKDVLQTVRSAKVGDRVQLEWVDTGEGLGITAFKILKKDSKDK